MSIDFDELRKKYGGGQVYSPVATQSDGGIDFNALRASVGGGTRSGTLPPDFFNQSATETASQPQAQLPEPGGGILGLIQRGLNATTNYAMSQPGQETIRQGLMRNENILGGLLPVIGEKPVDYAASQLGINTKPRNAAEAIGGGTMKLGFSLPIIGGLTNVATRGVKAAAPTLNPLLTRIAGSGLGFGAFEGGVAALEGEDAGGITKRAGLGLALGAGGEAAIAGIGKGLQTLGKARGAAQAGVETAEKAAVEVAPATAETGAVTKPTAAIEGITEDATKLKDIGGFRAYMTDIWRNVEAVFGKEAPKVKKALLDPFDAAKKANVEMQEEWLKKLKTDVVDKLGIGKATPESALVQQFGEKKITLDQLKQMRPNDWQKIVEADQWFRSAYDNLLDQVNASRKLIYPNQPEKLVPRRADYYRHFRELGEGFEGIKNIFDTPAQIDPRLAGISEFTKPSSRWASFMQRRGLGPYKNDAVGGFLNYIPAASYATKIDPMIPQFKNLAKNLGEATAGSKNVNNFINYLENYARDLAGKTNPADRFVQEVIPGGRVTFNVINWLNNRVKANTVLGNAASAVAQVANVPQGIAFAKQYSVPGIGRTLASTFMKNEPMAQSGFLKERFGQGMYRRFDTRWFQQPMKFANWAMETADRLGTNFIWNSAYEKALAEKVANPVKYADDWTRKLVAGRGIGEVPLLQKSRLFQLFAPFQLEVGNLWSVQRDLLKNKDITGLMTLYLASWMFNKAAEAVRGSGVILDPLQALIDAATNKDFTPVQRVGRLAGEVLSNVPGGQTIATVYPEYGMSLLGAELPSRKQFFGKEDPTRFGADPLLIKGLADPLFKLLPPLGGGQAKKTLTGINALNRGGVYQGDNPLLNILGIGQPSTEMKYPVASDTANLLKGPLFGLPGLRETTPYYEQNRRPLTEKQTRKVESSANPQGVYERINRQRRIETLEQQLNDLKKDKKMSREQKDREMDRLKLKLREIK